MKKISSEVKTGILVTATIGLAIWGFNMLKGRNLFTNDRDLYAVYDNVDNIVTNNPILFNGYKVGQVREVHRLPDNSGRLVVHFAITDEDFFIPTNSTAKIISDGFLGSKAIMLILGNGKVNVVQGDTLIGETQASMGQQLSSMLNPIRDRAQAVLSSIDSVMIIVQDVLNKDARGSLNASFESVKKAIATLAKTAGRLDALVESEGGKISSILSKLNAITTTITNNKEKIDNIMKNFSAISDSLAKAEIASTINNTNRAMMHAADIFDKINRGEGSMGLLVNDKKLYKELDSTSAALNKLFDDMRLHPKRYVHFSLFGKKEKRANKTEVDDLRSKVGTIQKENEDIKKQIEDLKKKQ